MSTLYDYFWAADRATAVDWAVGPGGDWRNGGSLDEACADRLEVKGLDPNVVLGKLVSFAAGIPFGSVVDPELVWPDPVEWPYGRQAPPGTASPWDSGLILQELPESWRDALAGVVEDAVPMLALQWWDIEETRFADYLHAEDSVRTFVGMARRARAAGARLYCSCYV
ncbi:hypothetical protein ACFWIO_04360 [Streptomyces diastatochromogenes]|uniref:hypothetical protein n=1 Tax=Streptomyces diastatochromogenes TaxID=42236 RepID=UPI00366403C4